MAVDSRLREWIGAHSEGQDATALAARDLALVLDEVDAIDLPLVGADESESAGSGTESLDADPPTVAVILVNLNGADHLRDCLDSLAQQDYPAQRLEVVLVDNASTDGSLELLAQDFSWVRVLPMHSNTGFAPAVNAGVRAAEAQCVVLLNNDARVDQRFVSELVSKYDPGSGAVCVGARIMSWDGETVDFVDGAVSYYGMGQQLGYGLPMADVLVEDGSELLFACGGAMLVDRETFLNVGGLDHDFFAYFEDVDFGWRLWLLGFRVVLAPAAVAYHRMHGTSSRFPLHQRYLLYERNALRMIIKNYSDENLQRVLAPALLLVVKRALSRGNLDRRPYDIGGSTDLTESVSRLGLAHLHAIGDIVDGLDGLMHARSLIQHARKRPDSEVLSRFKRPMWPVLEDSDYLRVTESVSRAFNLDSLFTEPTAARVLVVCNDGVGERMSGPAIRAVEIAKVLAGLAQVTLAVPSRSQIEIPGVTMATFSDEASLRLLADASDVVLFQGYTLHSMPALVTTSAVLVADLYDPWLFENIELHTGQVDADAALRGDAAVLNQILDECDFFICASERQRDYWLGMLSARNRLTQSQYSTDPSLRHLIDVVPFGLPERAPVHEQRVLKGVHPGIAEDDLVVLWGGGTWDWFDPLSLIEAWPAVVAAVPNAKLYFLGLQLTSENVKHMRVAHMATLRAEELGVADESVFFGDWVPYKLRESYLLESDIAVTVARDLAETRLAFRTRVLDYLWAGLPSISTEGDVLSDLVRNERLGLVVPAGSPAALTAAIIELLQRPLLRADMAHRARAAATRFRWSTAVEPMRRVVREPWRWDRSRAYLPRAGRVTEELRSLFDDAAMGSGLMVSGPRAASAADRAARKSSARRAEQIMRDHPRLMTVLYGAQRSRALGLRGTVSYARARGKAEIARRRNR